MWSRIVCGVFLGLMISCSVDVEEPDPCEEWTWIEEETCSADLCGAYDMEDYEYECREGECWCCVDDECWPA